MVNAAAERSGIVDPTLGAMTLRERFRRTMHYQPVDRLPNFEFGYWAETLPAWHEQGLPKEIDDQRKAYEYFGIESSRGVPVNTEMRSGLGRARIVESDERYEVGYDDIGAKYEINKSGIKSIPHYLGFPVQCREDFAPFREQLDADPAGRYPTEEEWQKYVEDAKKCEVPICIGISSMIGTLRNWMGFETCAYMVHDDPRFLEEMVESMCRVVEATLPRALQEVPIDYAMGWEDICFNSGPIVGRKFFADVVAPRYRRIADLLNKHGVDVIGVDCDGNVSPVADIMIDAGYNAFFPVEVVAWMERLPRWFEDENALYVHAGLPRDGDRWLHPSEAAEARELLWSRDLAFHRDYRGKPVVCGHTPTTDLPQEQSRFTPDDPKDLWVGARVAAIDTGCGKGGFLTALELPGFRVFESR